LGLVIDFFRQLLVNHPLVDALLMVIEFADKTAVVVSFFTFQGNKGSLRIALAKQLLNPFALFFFRASEFGGVNTGQANAFFFVGVKAQIDQTQQGIAIYLTQYFGFVGVHDNLSFVFTR
jgi:hypothetical protein